MDALTRPESKALAANVAGVYFALGDKNRGLEWLAKSIDRHELLATFAKFSPVYDDIRSDPQFQAQIARLNIPD